MTRSFQPLVATAMLYALVACSTQVRPVAPGWDGVSDPDCTEDYGSVAGDVVFGLLAVGAGLFAAHETKDMNESTLVGGAGIVVGTSFVASSAVGGSKVGECRAAKARWRRIRDGGGRDWCFTLADGRVRCAASETACMEQRSRTSATVRRECEGSR